VSANLFRNNQFMSMKNTFAIAILVFTAIVTDAQSLSILPFTGIEHNIYIGKDSGTRGYDQTFVSPGFMVKYEVNRNTSLVAGWQLLVHTKRPFTIPEKNYHRLQLGWVNWLRTKGSTTKRFYLKKGFQWGAGFNIQTIMRNQAGYSNILSSSINGNTYRLDINYTHIRRVAVTLPIAIHLQTMRRQKPFMAAIITYNRALGNGYRIVTHYENLNTGAGNDYTSFARGPSYGLLLTWPIQVK
jgi:hypothetical protein